MKIVKERSFGGKVAATAAKVAVAALLFPYQVTLDRKEGKYSLRSIALQIKADRIVKEDGSKHHEFSFSVPGCSVDGIKDKVMQKIKKYRKKTVILKKEAEEGSEEIFDGEFDVEEAAVAAEFEEADGEELVSEESEEGED